MEVTFNIPQKHTVFHYQVSEVKAGSARWPIQIAEHNNISYIFTITEAVTFTFFPLCGPFHVYHNHRHMMTIRIIICLR